jgi:glyoxylase-like metal-dependent hydrolase (beta-lactamase superfamily II)
MAKIKVLIEGYAKEDHGAELASSTVTLLQENGLNIIIDPGMDRSMLLDSLRMEGLTADKIDYVLLTHTHPDHCLLAGIFENAKILDNDSIYSFDGKIISHEGKIPRTDIMIIPTPGHDQFHCSVSVDSEEYGKVIVAGDVFWWRSDDPQKTEKDDLMALADPYVKNREQLSESRERILKAADYIIPGHGKMFQVAK